MGWYIETGLCVQYDGNCKEIWGDGVIVLISPPGSSMMEWSEPDKINMK